MAADVQFYKVVFAIPGDVGWCLDQQQHFQRWVGAHSDRADADLPEVHADLPALDAERADAFSPSELHVTWTGIQAQSAWAALQRAGETVQVALPELLAIPYARIEVGEQPERRSEPNRFVREEGQTLPEGGQLAARRARAASASADEAIPRPPQSEAEGAPRDP